MLLLPREVSISIIQLKSYYYYNRLLQQTIFLNMRSASMCFKYPSVYINNNYEDEGDNKGLS